MKTKLFQSTIIRLRDNKFYLMNHPDKGWASFAFEFSTLDHITDNFDITLGELSKDKYSEYIPAIVDAFALCK